MGITFCLNTSLFKSLVLFNYRLVSQTGHKLKQKDTCSSSSVSIVREALVCSTAFLRPQSRPKLTCVYVMSHTGPEGSLLQRRVATLSGKHLCNAGFDRTGSDYYSRGQPSTIGPVIAVLAASHVPAMNGISSPLSSSTSLLLSLLFLLP